MGALAVRMAHGVVSPPSMQLIDIRREMVRSQEERIQKDILDRLLGKGKASAVLDMEIDLRQRREEQTRGGAGMAEQYKEKGAKGIAAAPAEVILPGVYRQRNVLDPGRPKPEAMQGQSAQQAKTEEEEFFTQNLYVTTAAVKVLHDAGVADPVKKDIRENIVELMSPFRRRNGDPAITPADVFFIPQKVHAEAVAADEWLDQLKKPDVFIPLLYALLGLLLLLFLFGPFAGFMRRYTKALAEKPAAEINVESNIEPPEEEGEGGGGGGGGGAEESKMDILIGRKPPEAPPPPPEEEEEMKKFEPFAYINEESLKRLANLFLLRREEPWLIATVLSYLKPEYARQVLTALPVELQCKVALEALKVRQVTREQIHAIDQDIKENVDFVVGGIERLTRMLEEADNQTRLNILEYLKNQKPVVYEHVRRAVLLFDDIAEFPDRDMQAVVRALKAEDMAKALQGAPPEVVNKFFNNMSANAASLLKEQMEYTRDMTPAQIEEERAKIMAQIKAMEKDGKIKVRGEGGEAGGFQEVLATEEVRLPKLGAKPGSASEKGEDDALPGALPDLAKPVRKAELDPAAAESYFQSGMQFHEAGKYDEAVRSFRQAIEHNPELWNAYQYIGTDLYQMGRASEAVIYFEKLLEHSPDPQLAAWVESVKSQLKEQQGSSHG